MLAFNARSGLVRTLIATVGVAAAMPAMAQVGTSFTYQGTLDVDGAPATGVYDLQFGLFLSASGGTPVVTSCVNDVTVADGLLMATVDFGAQPFLTTTPMFIGVRVRPDAANGTCDFTNPSFTTLTTRQRVAPTPLAAQLRNVFVDANGRVAVNGSNPFARLEVQGGADAGGQNNPIAQSFAWRNNGFRHFISTRHDAAPGGGNGIDFFVNTSNQFNGSSIPGTGNVLALSVSAAQDGSIGVRNSNPTAPVSITGSTGGPGSSDSLLSLRNAQNAERWNVNLKDNELVFWETGSNLARVRMGTSSANALRVNGTTTTTVLTITGGSDIAEPFNVTGADEIRPGMVVSIDPARTGELRVTTGEYDATVAGIVSGANGVNPGLTLTQEGSVADGKHPIALTGRVWVLADASRAPIAAGDLLTTSAIPGHAMKVLNRERAGGATIGKAMSSLDSGTGYVLVLVNLQ